jgi:hypothetical protein
MYVEIVKNGESRLVKERYLKNFIDQGWKSAQAKKTKPAVKIQATAEVKPVQKIDDLLEDWADSEQTTNEKGEA